MTLSALIVLLVVIGGVSGLIICTSLFQRRFEVPIEFSRKILHFLASLLAAYSIHIPADKGFHFIGAVTIMLFLVVFRNSTQLSGLVSAKRSIGGPLFFVISYLILSQSSVPPVYISIGFIILGVSDLLACVTGKTLGTIKYSASNPKTFEGSAAFLFSSSLLLMLCLLWIDWDPERALATALVGGVFLSSVEAISTRGSDNFFIPLLSVAICGSVENWSDQELHLIAFYALSSIPVLAFAWRKKWVTNEGLFACLIVGGVLLSTIGLTATTVAFVFFLSACILSKISPDRFIQFDSHTGKSSNQIFALGLVPALAAVMSSVAGGDMFVLAYVSAVAAACSDTWATDIGRLRNEKPFLITTFEPATAGESGAVTIGGLFAGFFGALFIALVSVALGVIEKDLILVVSAAGFCGCLFDSFLGAMIQNSESDQCDAEKPLPQWSSASRRSRFQVSWISNEVVNLLMSAMGALCGMTFYYLVH